MTAIVAETADAAASSSMLPKAQSGDHDAFAKLVEQHEAMVYSLAYHFFNDRGRAEEIAQDVFLQLYRNLGTIESDAHLLFWLRQVTTRRCIDVTRRTRLKAVSLEDAGELRAAGRLRGACDAAHRWSGGLSARRNPTADQESAAPVVARGGGHGDARRGAGRLSHSRNPQRRAGEGTAPSRDEHRQRKGRVRAAAGASDRIALKTRRHEGHA